MRSLAGTHCLGFASASQLEIWHRKRGEAADHVDEVGGTEAWASEDWALGCASDCSALVGRDYKWPTEAQRDAKLNRGCRAPRTRRIFGEGEWKIKQGHPRKVEGGNTRKMSPRQDGGRDVLVEADWQSSERGIVWGWGAAAATDSECPQPGSVRPSRPQPISARGGLVGSLRRRKQPPSCPLPGPLATTGLSHFAWP